MHLQGPSTLIYAEPLANPAPREQPPAPAAAPPPREPVVADRR